jgi:hypothetical protein
MVYIGHKRKRGRALHSIDDPTPINFTGKRRVH